MSISAFQYVLWILPASLQLWLVIVMLRRELRQEYKCFFAYTAFHVVRFVVEFSIFHLASHIAYFFFYWAAGAVSVLLGFAVIYEIFRQSFEPYPGLREVSSNLFHWVALMLVLISAIIAVTSPGEYPWVPTTAILMLERSMRMMQVGMLVFLFLFTERLNLSWKHPIFGIALGFGIFACVELILATWLAQFGAQNTATYSLIKAATYNTSVLLWLSYMLAPQPEKRPVELVPQMEKLRLAFAGITPYPHDGFVSNVERTVERVLSKTDANGGLNGQLNGGSH